MLGKRIRLGVAFVEMKMRTEWKGYQKTFMDDGNVLYNYKLTQASMHLANKDFCTSVCTFYLTKRTVNKCLNSS